MYILKRMFFRTKNKEKVTVSNFLAFIWLVLWFCSMIVNWLLNLAMKWNYIAWIQVFYLIMFMFSLLLISYVEIEPYFNKKRPLNEVNP